MPDYVALLRGINVGKAKRVPMAELRRILQGLGFTDVATLLNSGNAVFRGAKAPPAKLAAQLAAALDAELGVDVPVIVKAAAEFSAILDENPFANEADDPSRLLVAFTQQPSSLDSLLALAPLARPPERFAVGARAAYLHCPAGILESRIGTALLGRAGEGATTRNWATCLKLQALLEARGA